ncbi:MADCA protein, partial [Trogon melanurus]|nr:MADCA protein [Trogon melanurus]
WALSPSLNPALSSFFFAGQPDNRLTVTPREPLVRYGSSVQLNCSLACAGGTVQWKGLDTNPGSITSSPTHSILHISSAEVAMEGTKICQGTCRGQHYLRSVVLKVYALPDTLQLEAAPRALEPGQPVRLRCSAQGVYPLSGLVLSWYWGHQRLEETGFDETETDEQLFDIVSTLSVSGKEVGEGVEFRCEATLSVGQEIFTRMASVAVSAGALMEQPVATATSMGTPPTAAATTGNPSTAGPMTTTAPTSEPRVPTHDPTTALTTAPPEPDSETILEPAAAAKPHSTWCPVPRDLTTGRPTARPATTALPSSGTASALAEAQGTSVGTISSGSPLVIEGRGPPCSLRIWSLPPQGRRGRALRIECHARCSGNATVRWVQTPVALSQYREEVAGSSSALWLDHAEPRHQGRYQCVLLGHRSQAVTLLLTVLDGSHSAGPAIAAGTTFSLLGLIVAGVVSQRLRRQLRPGCELP